MGAFSMGGGYMAGLGQPSFDDLEAPSLIAPLGDRVLSLSAGWGHGAAVIATDDESGVRGAGPGQVLVWGRVHDFRNSLRAVNMQTVVPWIVNVLNRVASKGVIASREPAALVAPAGLDFVSVECGPGAITAALTSGGEVYCVGGNVHGECGVGDTKQLTVWEWTRVQGLADAPPIVAIRAGFAHSLALDADGHLHAWGRSHRGQLGLGDTHSYKEALPLALGVALGEDTLTSHGRTVTAFDAGFSHSAAVASDGTAWVWGKMQGAEPSTADDAKDLMADALTPRRMVLGGDPALRAVDTACGHAHTVFLSEDGRLWLAGMRGRGIRYDVSGGEETLASVEEVMLSDSKEYCVEPLEVATAGTCLEGKRVTRLRAGLHHTYAVCEDGSVAWWGWRAKPVPYTDVAHMRVRDLAPSLRHMLVLADHEDAAPQGDE